MLIIPFTFSSSFILLFAISYSIMGDIVIRLIEFSGIATWIYGTIRPLRSQKPSHSFLLYRPKYFSASFSLCGIRSSAIENKNLYSFSDLKLSFLKKGPRVSMYWWIDTAALNLLCSGIIILGKIFYGLSKGGNGTQLLFKGRRHNIQWSCPFPWFAQHRTS